MTKNYQRRGEVRRSSGGSPSRRLTITFIAFVSGYLLASYSVVDQLGSWLSAQTFQYSSLVPVPRLAHQHSAPLKPKLEFYTLLTANHGDSQIVPPPPPSSSPPPSSVVAETKTHPTTIAATKATTVEQHTAMPTTKTQPVAAKAAFTIQVAAFRLASDADQMKASLLLKGFNAGVSAITSQGVTWFRVRVGPFASHEQAVQTQVLLARRERVNGMIRKMDA